MFIWNNLKAPAGTITARAFLENGVPWAAAASATQIGSTYSYRINRTALGINQDAEGYVEWFDSGASLADVGGVEWFGATVASRAHADEIAEVIATTDAIRANTDNLPASPAAVGDPMTLSSGERSTLAAVIEAAMINEGDATALLQAIADKLADEDITTTAIATAVRDAVLDRVLSGNHDTTGTVGKVLQTLLTSIDDLQADVDGLEAPDNAGIAAIAVEVAKIPRVGSGPARYTNATAGGAYEGKTEDVQITAVP